MTRERADGQPESVPSALGRWRLWFCLQRGVVQVGALTIHRGIYGGFAAEALCLKSFFRVPAVSIDLRRRTVDPDALARFEAA
jgi:hypothetical protein